MKYLLTLVLSFGICVCHAQYNTLFTSDYDVPNSLVNKIAEAKDGSIWIASENGLGQFNGSRFIVYNSGVGHPEYLADNFVRTVFADSKGNVIVGSIGGLQVFQPLTGTFTDVITNKKEGIPVGNVNDITPMRDGNFLIAGNDCFTLTNLRNQWRAVKNNLTGKVRYVFCAIEANDGSIFVAQSPNGVVRCDRKGSLKQILDGTGKKCYIRAFCMGPDGVLYAGSGDYGLYRYSPNRQRFDLIPGTEYLSSVCEIKVVPGTNRICIATDAVGAKMFDTRTQRFVQSMQLSTPLVDLSKQKVHSVYITKDGDIWMALYQKGIFVATSKHSGFVNIGGSKTQNNLLDDHCVTSILQTHDGNIWATTDNGGLYGLSHPQGGGGGPGSGEFKSVGRYPCGGSTFDRRQNVPPTILGLFEDSKHRVWYGSYSYGGGILNLNTGVCLPIHISNYSSMDFNIYGYAEDKHGQIWVASMGSGIMRYDEKNNVFVPYINKGALMWTGSIYYDKRHDVMYCGTYEGIVRFKVQSRIGVAAELPRTETLRSEVGGSRSKVQGSVAWHVEVILPKVVVYSITPITNDVIGFATNQGLVLLTVSTGKMRTITMKQGLPDNNICAVQPSGNGSHLWISTMCGLTCFNMNTQTAETYTIRDGLQGNEFYKNASLTSKDGRLWFGGINGITTFIPHDVEMSHQKCQPLVVDLRAGENYFRPDEAGVYNVPDGITSFTISFATHPLYMTHSVNYIYRIDEGNWEILTAPQNRMRFNNLSYGSHVLEVKTTIGGKETSVSRTDIYIRYPWYLKWWMVCLWIGVGVGVGIGVIVSIRHHRHITQRLRQQQDEHQLEEYKLQFFMNIVHDLRTPLTLIVTPLQKLIKSDRDESRQHIYQIISRNADRLVRLTNEIMDLRKLDKGKIQLQRRPIEVSKLVGDIVRGMKDIAEARQQELIYTDHTDGTAILMLDRDNLEKILVNLIDNAQKYTPMGGRIEVQVDVNETPQPLLRQAQHSALEGERGEKGSELLVINVIDNGVGIPEESRNRIFERFYQVRVQDKHIKGSGIGLSLVKALVELFNGEIRFTDNPEGKGTVFTVTLPCEKYCPEPVSVSDSMFQESVSMSRSKKTILVVDDEDGIRNFLMEELSDQFNVLEASDGRQAYDILCRPSSTFGSIDLVISDVMMPNTDGLELTRMIRQNVRLAHLPVILLTAKSSDQDHLEGFQATADAYVTKPFNIELLKTFIVNLLDRQDKLRNTFKGNDLPADKIETPEVQSPDEKLLERIIKVINKNLDNPDLTSDMLAREAGLSRVHMYRKLKELTNQSATNYIRNIRLTKAAELLRQGKANVSEVAYLVGFRTPAHFSTAFKELYGVSPKDYAKQNAG